jgi:hypothetical protein
MGMEWNGEYCFTSNAKFKFITSNYETAKTTPEEIILLKGQYHLSRYQKMMHPTEVQGIVEFGIFEGGSAIILAQMFPNAKIVAFDFRQENPHVTAHLERLGLKDRVKQDRARIQPILEKEFSRPIDFVIDDCSHYYLPTKQSFDIAFPFLKPGGWYFIEDWDWAHGENYRHWPSPVLSNFIFELVSVTSTRSNLIEEAITQRGFTAFRKGSEQLRGSIDDYLQTPGREWPKI